MRVIGKGLAIAVALASNPFSAGMAWAQASDPGAPAEGASAKPAAQPGKHVSRKRKTKGSDPSAMKKKNVTGVAQVKGVKQPVQKAP